MAADVKAKWQEARAQILAALNILEEYERFGVRTISRSPNKNGWLPAHAIDREDKNPSAGINIGDGPLRGRYKDFAGTQQTCSFFDFAQKHGKFGGDWKQVIVHFSRQTGIKLPDAADDTILEKLDVFDLTAGVMYQWAKGKPGITADAIKRFGGMGARWPKKLSPEKTNHLIVYPCHGAALLDMDATGWHATAANPTQLIRKYQGKDADEKLLKTLQLADYGLMNVAGLRRLPKAEVVVLLEGISDGLCAESICPQDSPEVPLTCGGCSYDLKTEWLQHFLGKELWVCFDVGDPDDAGGIGAMRQVAAAVAAGITVRNIKLPEPPGGGKMDFRAWINSGKTWAEFVEYALTFSPVTVDDVESQLTEHQALLLRLGITVIGEHEASQKIEVFSEHSRKAATIYDIDKLSYAKLVQMVGYAKVDEFVHDGKEEVAGKSQLKEVRHAIASDASEKQFSYDERLGAGVWRIDGKIVLVGNRNYSVLDTSIKLSQHHTPFYKGKVLDTGVGSPAWFDHGNVGRLMLSAQSDRWCIETFEEAERLFSKWYWKYPPTPRVMAALVGCSFLQSIWEWRPGVAITGGSDSGKSKLMNDVLSEGLFGEMALTIQKPSEAAIRQHMKQHSKILLVDELEHDQNRSSVLKLLRVASAGGEILKGTADQKGATYRLKHLVWLTAIELGMREQADLNRYIFCELKEIPPKLRGAIDLPSKAGLNDLGQRLMAIAIRHHKTVMELFKVLKRQQYADAPGRLVEVFSVPCALISAIYGHDEETAIGMMGAILEQWDFAGQQVKDEVRLLEEIFTSEILLNGGKRMSVSQLLSVSSIDPDNRAALQRNGLSRFTKRHEVGLNGAEPPERLFISQEVVKTKLIGKGNFGQQQIEQYLLRLDGALRDKQRLGGSHAVTGVSIPLATISKLLEQADADDIQEDAEFTFD